MMPVGSQILGEPTGQASRSAGLSACLTSHVVATSYSEGKLRMTTSETILPSRTEK